MNANLFLDNGAIITMANDQTHFFKESDLQSNLDNSADNSTQDSQKTPGYKQWFNTQGQPAYRHKFLNPGFSLKELNQPIQFNSVSLGIPEDFSKILGSEKSNHLEQVLNQGIEDLDWTSDEVVYKKKYQKIMGLIKKGELKKAVPFITYKSLKPKDFNQKILSRIISRLLKLKHSDEYLYGLWGQDQGFVGATPEVLIQRKPKSKNYNTMALAGTLPLADPTNMLLDSKLLDEHQIVMQDISKKLSGHNVVWDDPKEKKYGILKHIHAEANFSSDLDLNSIIEKLSPTSALGVYPSEHWRDYDDILDIDGRGSYGAPFGLVTDTELMVLVCLRGLFWDERHLYIRVGGGVTSQSVYENEIEELELKFLSTKTKLGI